MGLSRFTNYSTVSCKNQIKIAVKITPNLCIVSEALVLCHANALLFCAEEMKEYTRYMKKCGSKKEGHNGRPAQKAK